MKIAVWHNLISGGGKRALQYHIKALRQRGHYLEVWTPDTSLNDSIHTIDANVKQHIYPLKERLQRISKPRFSFQHYKYINKKNEIIKQHCELCAREINKEGFDLLFANSCSINYMSFVSLYSKVPSVIYLGEPFRLNYEAVPNLIWSAMGNKISIDFLKNHLSLVANRIQVFEEIRAAKAYSKILVNSLYSRESVMRSYGIDSEVCYLGIDDSFFSTRKVEKKTYVVCVGLIYYLKGIDRVIKAIAKVPVLNRPKLICIGNGALPDYKREIEILAQNLNVDLEILLNISDEEMKRIVSEACAMVYMPRLEPFGLTPLEANALGTAVIGIAEGGVRESIANGKNGFLIHNENYDSAAFYIEKFVTDLRYATEMGQQSKEHVMVNWSFKNLSENIESALKIL